MNRFHALIAGALAACGLLGSVGCDRLFDKGVKENVAAAEKKSAAGDFRGAVSLYEAALDDTTKSADIHYKLALLYDDKLKRPVDAIHHLDRYLELAPAGSRAKDATALRKEEENRLRAEIAGGSPMSQQEAVALKNENQKLLKEIEKLRAQKALPAATVNAKGEPAQLPIPPGARTYVVQSGDTFAKIARKFYNNAAKAKAIQTANFGQYNGTVVIKPGMTLAIPK